MKSFITETLARFSRLRSTDDDRHSIRFARRSLFKQAVTAIVDDLVSALLKIKQSHIAKIITLVVVAILILSYLFIGVTKFTENIWGYCSSLFAVFSILISIMVFLSNRISDTSKLSHDYNEKNYDIIRKHSALIMDCIDRCISNVDNNEIKTFIEAYAAACVWGQADYKSFNRWFRKVGELYPSIQETIDPLELCRNVVSVFENRVDIISQCLNYLNRENEHFVFDKSILRLGLYRNDYIIYNTRLIAEVKRIIIYYLSSLLFLLPIKVALSFSVSSTPDSIVILKIASWISLTIGFILFSISIYLSIRNIIRFCNYIEYSSSLRDGSFDQIITDPRYFKKKNQK